MPDVADTAVQPTLGAALRQATADLRRAGIEGPGDDARRLLAAVLSLSAAQLLGRPERTLSAAEIERLDRCIARRVDREPVSRILGTRDFYGRTFEISPATLDPRPESETLIAAALELAATIGAHHRRPEPVDGRATPASPRFDRLTTGVEIAAAATEEGTPTRPLRILDVGTGSGCLLLTLLAELPHAEGVGTDRSAASLHVARINAERLGVAARAQWLVADALEPLRGTFDILISNPPYIPSGEIAHLAPEVRRYDPLLALDGGPDGLRFFHRLVASIPCVVPDGWVVLEVGHDQADAVGALLTLGLSGMSAADTRIYRDVAGRRRCVAARTRN
jgi:release factor glutamine methyltransferase